MRYSIALIALLSAQLTTVRASAREPQTATLVEHEGFALLEGSASGDSGALLATLIDGGGTAESTMSSPDSNRVGRLEGGVPIGDHPEYVVRNPARSWATEATEASLRQAFDAMAEEAPGGARITLLDISLRAGGPMPGHRSHQNGRDVDLAYYRRACDGPCGLGLTSQSQLDSVHQWRLLQHWLKQRQVEFVFIDYELQRPLYEVAKEAGASDAELMQWFQYPRGVGRPVGVIRHADNHRDHLHVRFRCDSREPSCTTPRRRSRAAATPIGHGAPAPGSDGVWELQTTLDAADAKVHRSMLELLEQTSDNEWETQ